MLKNLPFVPKILADSYNNLYDSRVTTFLVPWPTIKLAELRTHRVVAQTDGILEIPDYLSFLSMNANSTRAIPVEKVKESVSVSPYIPMWTKNKSGMQGDLIEDESLIKDLDTAWLWFRDDAIRHYEDLEDLGIHKQHISHFLNIFSWSVCVLSADHLSWSHYFNLRTEESVYPEVREISRMMKEEYDKSNPKNLNSGEWHIPFEENCFSDNLKDKLLVSVSCCARISYDNNEIEVLEKHKQRAIKCIKNGHVSTCEHQFMVPFKYDADELEERLFFDKTSSQYKLKKGKYHSNIKGWISLRKLIESKEWSIENV